MHAQHSAPQMLATVCRTRRCMQMAFALAGGQLPAPWAPAGLLPDAWLLGVRTGNYRCVLMQILPGMHAM